MVAHQERATVLISVEIASASANMKLCHSPAGKVRGSRSNNPFPSFQLRARDSFLLISRSNR